MPKPSKLTIAITGANGYVGGRIATYLKSKGHSIISLSRTPSPNSRPFSLGEPIIPKSLEGLDALIHCAWDFNATSKEAMHKINIQGSLDLLSAAKKAGIKRIVFISTMSAFDGCLSLYGKAKLEIERKAPKGIIIIRPGLVYDEEPKGMLGALKTLTKISPIAPKLAGGNQMFHFCHSEDLSKLTLELIESKTLITKPVLAANEKGMRFKDILQSLARSQGKRIVLIPTPIIAVSLPLKLAELLKIKTRLRSDSIIGLLNANPNPDFSITRMMGTKFRPSPFS